MNPLKGWNSSDIWEQQNSIQEETEQIEVMDCLLSGGAKSFVVQFAVQKYKD